MQTNRHLFRPMRSALSSISCLLIAVQALSSGCTGKKDNVKKAVKKRDWSRASLVEVEAKAKDVAFRIAVPSGLMQEKDSISVTWQGRGAEEEAPRVHVNVSELPPPDDLQSALGLSMFSRETDVLLAHRAVDKGFLLMVRTKDGRKVNATLYKELGRSRTFYCSASIRQNDPIDEVEAKAEWLSKICMSARPE